MCEYNSISPVYDNSFGIFRNYLQYKLESLNSKEVYDTNNYLSPYKFCNLQTLEETIEKLSDILQEDRKKIMLDTIDKIKENYLTKEEA